ncbi:hypothetical protein BD770DRAFT_445822 [Pilaira anomala]|nr:hypothetical protein BD770DRAFT_445822 [Pilaira anomala]
MSTHIVNIKANTSHVVHLEKQSKINITNDKIKSSTTQHHFYQKKKQSKSSHSSFNTKVPIVMIPKKTSASAPNTPQQQRRTVLPVKARRVERRKEIVSIKLELSAISSESDDSISSSFSSSLSNSRRKKNNGLVVPIVQNNKRNEQQQQQLRRRSSSSVDIRSTVYAGPTFNNSPAPNTLPIPAFSPPSTIGTNISSIELERQKLSRHSKDLMKILSPQPLKNDFDLDLSEIQRGLRSMLKI